MVWKEWGSLPDNMRLDDVKPYFDILQKRKCSLFLKRVFDVMLSFLMLVALSPFFVVFAIMIKMDSPGPVFFRQERVTQYGRVFKIFKFRTMTADAQERGPAITVNRDCRVTRTGRIMRKYRLDEIPQLIDILRGTMTFVGTRPEVSKYVAYYTPKMMATLLLPAGVTSLASIFYAEEASLLDGAADPDKVYIEKILPEKMKYNLQGIQQTSFCNDLKLMMMTVLAMCGKKFEGEESGSGYPKGSSKGKRCDQQYHNHTS